MNEFSNRVDAQRQILRAVNNRPWKNEQLFALNQKAIQRWIVANQVDPSSKLVQLLNEASAQIFVMANHSDDPIAGAYLLTKERVYFIENLIREELK
jgi:hypothetical protein